MQTNDAQDTYPLASNSHLTFDVLCGVSVLADSFALKLKRDGFRHDPNSLIKLVIDVQRGFAMHILETLNRLDRANLRLIVVTYSFCIEYWEDLWDLQPDVLIVDASYEHDYGSAVHRVWRGEQYRLTPNGTTRLSHTERQVLRYLARSYSNLQIAQLINVQEKTVRNNVSSILSKLGLKRREQLSLYYWGLWHDLGMH